LGYPEIVVRDWQGIVAPAGTPPSVLKRLADALGETLGRPETRERLAALALEPVADSDPAAFAAFFAAEIARWSTLARKINLQAQ
jgi:tripartite-type tricarboxylate transporter receptor subunit TctC